MKKTISSILIAIALMSVSGCYGNGKTVAATVGKEKIYVEDVEAFIQDVVDYNEWYRAHGYDDGPYSLYQDIDRESFYKSKLERKITDSLISQKCKKLNINVSSKEIDELQKQYEVELPSKLDAAAASVILQAQRANEEYLKDKGIDEKIIDKTKREEYKRMLLRNKLKAYYENLALENGGDETSFVYEEFDDYVESLKDEFQVTVYQPEYYRNDD